MSAKDKFYDILLTLIVWIILSCTFELLLTDDGFTKVDFTYWFGTFLGYSIAIVQKKIIVPVDEKETSNKILDDIKSLKVEKNSTKNLCICERNAKGEKLIGFCPKHKTDWM